MTSLMGLARGKGHHGGASTPNLIANGSFVDHVDGWYGSKALQAVTFDAGQLSVISTNEDDPGSSVWYRPGGVPSIPLNGLTTLDAVGFARSGDVDAHARVRIFFGNEPLLSSTTTRDAPDATGTPIGSSLTAFGGRGISVPDGSTHMLILLKGPDTVHYDDVYVGPAGGDAPPYPTASLPLGERVYNGTFETNIDDWHAIFGGETLTRETGNPLAGTGSLKVVTPGSHAGEGVYDADGSHVIIPGESLRVRMLLIGGGALSVELNVYPATNVAVWTGTPSTDPENPTVIDETVLIPSNAGPTEVLVFTVGTQAITFYVDNVSLTAVP